MAPGGSVVGRGSAAVHPHPGPGGAVVQDPEELLGSVVTAWRQALVDAGEDVGVVGLGNQGETVLAWSPDTGRTHGPAISWQDRRAAGVVGELAEHADRRTEPSGLPLDRYFAAPRCAGWRPRRAAAPRSPRSTAGSTTGSPARS
jgi:glycerol kinase